MVAEFPDKPIYSNMLVTFAFTVTTSENVDVNLVDWRHFEHVFQTVTVGLVLKQW